MKTPVINTQRLILRPLTVADAQRVFCAWTSDPRVTKYMIYDTHKTVKETREWLESVEAKNDSDVSYNWGFVLKETGELIGSGGGYYVPDYDRFSIGYNIMFDYWHKGITTEAMAAIMDFLKNTAKIKKFMSDHAVDNIYSGKVMEKLGLTYHHDGEYKKANGTVFKAKYYYLDV